VQASNGNFYGTTSLGGAHTLGTVFKITPKGALTTLYSFCAKRNCADGTYPLAPLIQATDGNLYGTTFYGGGGGSYGTVFRITPAGKLKTLHAFAGYPTEGYYPYSGLVQASDGNLYGTTQNGGGNYDGTVFRITTAGALTTLYSFCDLGTGYPCPDGLNPSVALIQATDGNLYGTTVYGGSGAQYFMGLGTIFDITTGGTETALYDFCTQTGCPDGDVPWSSLLQATSGMFYGMTAGGGSGGCNGGCGTVFSLSMGLRPFVETLPTSGKVGAKVVILGNNLKGTTSVSFNGTTATFHVVSATEIKTTVPTGATTGTVQVTTPGGTLNSNVVFRIP